MNALKSVARTQRVKHYVNGKNFGTGQKWSETRGDPEPRL